MTPDDAVDAFTELPPRVQVALMSLLRQLRDRPRVQFWEYDADVAGYLAGTGLVDTRLPGDGWRTVQFRKNDCTRALYERWGDCVRMTSVE